MKFVATGLVAATFVLCAAQVAAPATAPVVVRATIWPNLIITFSPKTFDHGTVVLKVKNRTDSKHKFSINGVTTPMIKPHTTASMTVNFKLRAIYTATLPDCTYASTCTPIAGTSPIGSVKVT